MSRWIIILLVLQLVILVTIPTSIEQYNEYKFQLKAKQYLSGHAPTEVKMYCNGWANHVVLSRVSHVVGKDITDLEILFKNVYENCVVQQAYFDRRN